MSELALAGIVVALVVVVAAFFGLRGLRPRDPVRREDAPAPQEPKFGDEDSSATTTGADEKNESEPARPVQQSLVMTSFTPPKLPEPPEELIPLDICHSVRLHCREEAETEWLRGEDLEPLRAGLRECGLPVFRFLACGDEGEWRAVENGGGRGGAALSALADGAAAGGPRRADDGGKDSDGGARNAALCGVAEVASGFSANGGLAGKREVG